MQRPDFFSSQWMRRFLGILAVAVALQVGTGLARAGAQGSAGSTAPELVTLPSQSPLVKLRIMVRAGSAQDPTGREGTAGLVGQMLVEGGFGEATAPVTKEALAEITRPWGETALPQVGVDKQATVISVTVPRDNFTEFVRRVLRPMLQEPLFLPAELDRLRRDALVHIRSSLRFENQETLGLLALDNEVLSGTPLDHLVLGTVSGVKAVTPGDLRTFYQKYYRSGNMTVSTTVEPSFLGAIAAALPVGSAEPALPVPAPRPLHGRHVTIITQPNAIATGIHFGCPIACKRGDADYWPLFVANLSLGLHRDSFGRLYQDIREERGYNYGDYAYLEYYEGRPQHLFPPPGTPRTQQYFSVWIRPVGHAYAHFIMKAATAEVARFVREGMTAEQVAAARVRARTLYLKYADSTSRQLGYRLDDLFYGMGAHGYLVDMLARVDAVTPEQVNAAIRRHLQVTDLDYVITTNESEAARLADDIAGNRDVKTKTLEEYHISKPVSPEKRRMLVQDATWVAYPLDITRDKIRIVKAEEMFER